MTVDLKLPKNKAYVQQWLILNNNWINLSSIDSENENDAFSVW